MNNDISVASDGTALREKQHLIVMQCRLKVILYTGQYNECSYSFGIDINRKFHEIND